MYLPVADAVDRTPLLANASVEERTDRLVHLVMQHHWLPGTLATLSLRDAWRVVRDAVEAVERCSAQRASATGAEKLQLVEAVVWRVIDSLGGVGGLRALLLAQIPGGGVGRTLVSWVVTERVVRSLVRYTIELAVRESWHRERRVQVTGLQRAKNQQPNRGRE